MKIMKTILVIALIILGQTLLAQSNRFGSRDKQLSILFGLNQPIVLGGFNVEANFWTKRFVVDYSHGFNLHVDGEFAGGEIERQQLDILVTNSLGLGLGYRITRGFNVRLEPKIHFFELYYKGEVQNAENKIGDYSTFTFGVGAYYRWMPWENKLNGWRGLTVSPSVRFWPNISSSLDNDELTYNNKLTGNLETHSAANIGVSDSPWIFNISIGYTFNL